MPPFKFQSINIEFSFFLTFSVKVFFCLINSFILRDISRYVRRNFRLWGSRKLFIRFPHVETNMAMDGRILFGPNESDRVHTFPSTWLVHSGKQCGEFEYDWKSVRLFFIFISLECIFYLKKLLTVSSSKSETVRAIVNSLGGKDALSGCRMNCFIPTPWPLRIYFSFLFFCACGRSANTKALMGQGRDNGDDSAAGITQHNGGADEGGNAS